MGNCLKDELVASFIKKNLKYFNTLQMQNRKKL